MSKHFVAILMGSDSDLPLVQNTIDILKSFNIKVEVRVASAHRTPDVVSSFVQDSEKRGCGGLYFVPQVSPHI